MTDHAGSSRYEDHGGRCRDCGKFLAGNGYLCDGCDELEVDHDDA